MLSSLRRPDDPDLLVGAETADDAAVYRLRPDLAIVQTVDFITPIVDDPFLFGAVAAANSLSDVYAMGGRPLTALNVVCFPEEKLGIDVLGEILRGSEAKCEEAGCITVGGHTVVDPELKFGLSVTGTVHPDRVLRNRGALPGDVLVLTKPLGTGILATALKKGKLAAAEAAELGRSMAALNARAAALMTEHGAHAATDITGFGLAGHAMEMAAASEATLAFNGAALPLLPGAIECARRGFLTGADRRNRDYVGDLFRLEGRVADELVAIVFDAQTSGGLLVSLPEAGAQAMCEQLEGVAVVVGRVLPGPAAVVVRR